MILSDQHHRSRLLPTRYPVFNKLIYESLLIMLLITSESQGNIYGLWSMRYISVSSASPACNSADYGFLRILWYMINDDNYLLLMTNNTGQDNLTN